MKHFLSIKLFLILSSHSFCLKKLIAFSHHFLLIFNYLLDFQIDFNKKDRINELLTNSPRKPVVRKRVECFLMNFMICLYLMLTFNYVYERLDSSYYQRLISAIISVL